MQNIHTGDSDSSQETSEAMQVRNAADLSQVLLRSGVPITAEQLRLLSQYVEQLLEWNKKINLISRKAESQVWREQILHSLAALSVVQFPASAKYVDIGTGGGLPGMPLAIMFPASEFILCDSIGKKIHAVEDMVKELGLVNVRCVHARAEDLARMPEYRASANIVLARAVTRLHTLVELSKPLLRIRGDSRLITWKGGDMEDEIHIAGQDPSVADVSLFRLQLVDFPYFVQEDKKIVQVRFYD